MAGIALRPAKMQEDVHGRWVGYLSVPDVAQSLSAATVAGGRVLFAAKSVPLRGTQAVFVDPDGAEMGLMHSTSGDPAEFAPDPGDWTWTELFARDPIKAGQFYRSVAGYDVMLDSRSAKADTYVLVSGGYSRGSIAPVPNRPKARPVWLLFVRVANLKDTVSKVASLGGKVLSSPSSDPSEYWKAIVADPAGAPIGLVELEETPAPKEAP